MIVHAGVRKMLRHVGNNVPLGCASSSAVAAQIEAEQRIAILKSLRPLRPAAGRIAAGDCEDRRAIARLPAPIESESLLRRQFDSARFTAGNRSFAAYRFVALPTCAPSCVF